MSDLDARLLQAHYRKDQVALVSLYDEAAEQAPDDDARGFFLTHAYVYALELGDRRAPRLREKLVDMGRETPL